MTTRTPSPLPLHTEDALLSLCAKAGDLIAREYHGAHADEYREKSDDSPITRADVAAHHCLVDGLRSLLPDIPVLSEESPQEVVAQRHDWQRLWLVDPLDGTREFLDRSGEFTVNLALVEDAVPRLGILYLPLEQVAYLGIPGDRGWRCQRREEGWARRELVPRSFSREAGTTVLASRRHSNAQLDKILALLASRAGPVERLDSGSALKFTQLADGGGDCYPRFSPCSEWDVAAGQAILESVGGAVLGLDGRPLRYNARETLLSPHFLAVADSRARLWRQLLDALA
ncbi:MAG: 3'(2'),5'-bisphosphate nucleotidase CysQ [Chromatocurvus sp.]